MRRPDVRENKWIYRSTFYHDGLTSHHPGKRWQPAHWARIPYASREDEPGQHGPADRRPGTMVDTTSRLQNQ